MKEARDSWILGPDSSGRALRIEDGRIADFGTDLEIGPFHLSCEGARIEVGRVNAHTHIYSGLVPFGMPAPEPPPENFVQILERIWWRLDRAFDEQSLRAATRYYVAEALLAGTTTLIDHHESPGLIEGSLDVLADGCGELGVRSLLCYGATERNGGPDEGARGLRESARFLRENRNPLLRGAVALHASFTVSDDTIREAAAICRSTGSSLHVHLAEDVADVEDARKRGFGGPLERLIELGAPLEGSILAHGVHLDRKQVERARDEGAWLVQNPRSNRGNGVGYPTSLAFSSRVALGTDGFPADMAAEEAALLNEADTNDDDRATIAERVKGGWRMASDLFGIRLTEEPRAGDAADLRVVDDKGRVQHVIVNGIVLVRHGQLISGDIDRIRTEAEEEAGRLWRRMEKI
ncbi:MAG: amidohydrolase [Gemmatimonadetes bacterium]|nr:amidohydrolase [Gemmatimonadota bacterium]